MKDIFFTSVDIKISWLTMSHFQKLTLFVIHCVFRKAKVNKVIGEKEESEFPALLMEIKPSYHYYGHKSTRIE